MTVDNRQLSDELQKIRVANRAVSLSMVRELRIAMGIDFNNEEYSWNKMLTIIRAKRREGLAF